ncbi:MAG: hypothetical protein ACE5GW_01955, partial [Planctomycetota bacterium]
MRASAQRLRRLAATLWPLLLLLLSGAGPEAAPIRPDGQGDPPPAAGGVARAGGRGDTPASRRGSLEAGTLRGIALLHLDDDLGAHGYGTAAAVESLRSARAIGASWVSLRIPGRQPSVAEPRISFAAEPPGEETDEVVRRTIRDARRLGFRVFLKPHIMLGRITAEEWRGTIAFESVDERERWWSDYRRFILHYARFASKEKVDLYGVGLELRGMVLSDPERWRSLIREVRGIYDGLLTYSANWYLELEEVPFWDDLDLIGVQFFYPLSDAEKPSRKDLRNGLGAILPRLEKLSRRHRRLLLLTEVGYKSTPGALKEPWVWPETGSAPDLELQASAYTAVFEAFHGRPWCAGMFWWNWLTEPTPPEKFLHDFTPQGKPAS